MRPTAHEIFCETTFPVSRNVVVVVVVVVITRKRAFYGLATVGQRVHLWIAQAPTEEYMDIVA